MCLLVCDIETWIVRRSRPDLGCCAAKMCILGSPVENQTLAHCNLIGCSSTSPLPVWTTSSMLPPPSSYCTTSSARKNLVRVSEMILFQLFYFSKFAEIWICVTSSWERRGLSVANWWSKQLTSCLLHQLAEYCFTTFLWCSRNIVSLFSYGAVGILFHNFLMVQSEYCFTIFLWCSRNIVLQFSYGAVGILFHNFLMVQSEYCFTIFLWCSRNIVSQFSYGAVGILFHNFLMVQSEYIFSTHNVAKPATGHNFEPVLFM
jgi:hypothetical protein